MDGANAVSSEPLPEAEDPTQDSVRSGAATTTNTPTTVPSVLDNLDDLGDGILSSSSEEPHSRSLASTMSVSSLFSNLFVNRGDARILRIPELPGGTQIPNYIFITQRFTMYPSIHQQHTYREPKTRYTRTPLV